MVWLARSMLRWRCCLRLGFSYTILVGMCVPALARFLVALQCHFLMTCGQHVVCECLLFLRNHDSCLCKVQRRLMVWAFCNFGTYAMQCLHRFRNGTCVNPCCSASASPSNKRHISWSRGLRFNGTRSVSLYAHQHFDSTSSRLRLCRRASELVEYPSTNAAERDDVASVAHLAN